MPHGMHSVVIAVPYTLAAARSAGAGVVVIIEGGERLLARCAVRPQSEQTCRYLRIDQRIRGCVVGLPVEVL